MSLAIRPAQIADLDAMVDLLCQDGETRHAMDPTLWKLVADPHQKLHDTIKAVMENETPPFRQQWLLAETNDAIVGLSHTILLPVPPIYAGELGAPGLIMEDCFVARDAPKDTSLLLLKAAEADLIEAGAKILLASSITGGAWEPVYSAQGYASLTAYLAKVGLSSNTPAKDVRKAVEADVPAIVKSSAVHRQILRDLNERFWKPHAEADARFGAWMNRSLTLTDRDMFVSPTTGSIQGYAISQPATPLHFPTPHDIQAIAVIDDFHHEELTDPHTLANASQSATALLHAAETARQARGDAAVLVVCPAAWRSKIELLQAAGYETAITWYIKA